MAIVTTMMIFASLQYALLRRLPLHHSVIEPTSNANLRGSFMPTTNLRKKVIQESPGDTFFLNIAVSFNTHEKPIVEVVVSTDPSYHFRHFSMQLSVTTGTSAKVQTQKTIGCK
jgi:hypothetical protein